MEQPDGKISVFKLAKALPYTMGKALLRKHWGPITPDLTLALYRQVYREWKSKQRGQNTGVEADPKKG